MERPVYPSLEELLAQVQLVRSAFLRDIGYSEWTEALGCQFPRSPLRQRDVLSRKIYQVPKLVSHRNPFTIRLHRVHNSRRDYRVMRTHYRHFHPYLVTLRISGGSPFPRTPR